MIVPQLIQQKYDLVRPYVDEVGKRVRDVVLGYCEDQGFAYISRTKTSASLAEKIETGRYSTWSELDDLFACSIVIPALGDEASVLDYLRNSFRELACKQRGSTQKNPDVFRFDATRFIGALKPDALPHAGPMHAVRFEVQIRTAFEHAWVVTTHALATRERTLIGDGYALLLNYARQ